MKRIATEVSQDRDNNTPRYRKRWQIIKLLRNPLRWNALGQKVGQWGHRKTPLF